MREIPGPDDLVGAAVHAEMLEVRARMTCLRNPNGTLTPEAGEVPVVPRGGPCWSLPIAFWCDRCLDGLASFLRAREERRA
jgi:hypothetical protein